MKNPFSDELEGLRQRSAVIESATGDRFGLFRVPVSASRAAIVIVSNGRDADAGPDEPPVVPWEHVSVRVVKYQRTAGGKLKQTDETPSWDVMCRIKDLFFDEDETVLQFHPPKRDYVNIHPNVLHLWKPIGLDVPRPPVICV